VATENRASRPTALVAGLSGVGTARSHGRSRRRPEMRSIRGRNGLRREALHPHPPPPNFTLNRPTPGPVGPVLLPTTHSGRPCSIPCLWPIAARSQFESFERAVRWAWFPLRSTRTWIVCRRTFSRPTRRRRSDWHRHRRATSVETISSKWLLARGRAPFTPGMDSSPNGLPLQPT